MGKECGAWVSRRLWGGGNTSPLKTTAWEANNNQNRDKLNDDLQKFAQTSGQILRTFDVMMKMRSHLND